MKLRKIHLAILGAVDQGPRSSMEIIRELQDQGFWFARGRAYNALAELEEKGMLIHYKEPKDAFYLGTKITLDRHMYKRPEP